jgi:5-methylcytosine-specific restriction endonuclease McrA
MVAKLPLPDQNSSDIVIDVIASRRQQKDFFEALEDDWVEMIDAYQNQAGNPSVITPLDLSQYISDERIQVESGKAPRRGESADVRERLYSRRKNSLINLYGAKDESDLHTILDGMRRNHGLKFCPSCGEAGKPGTLDHYLPKTEYPEFSIVLINLTPMCEACQEKKGTSALDDEGNKLFIHPYYDPIEDTALSLIISEPYESPSAFSVEVHQDVGEPLRSLFDRHLRKIQFFDRFEEFCIDEYSDLLSVFSKERDEDNPDSAQRIVGRFKNKNERQSLNRWEAIFYRGVLSNPDLLEYLDNGVLPDCF